ncbi:MAG: hypothetical protein ABJC26_17875 [Gemmatimonadaceae bacterium]
MHQEKEPPTNAYPTGRGYGNDYMRGGEVFGGYGYSSRPEYEQRRGDSAGDQERRRNSDVRQGSISNSSESAA